jgi:hypothetical protein
MKRVTAILAAASLFSVAPVMPTPAIAADTPGNTVVVDRCKATSGVFPEETLGNCVALLTTNAVGRPFGWIVQICSFFMKSRPDDFYAAYDSFNECVLDGGDKL